MSKLGTQMVKKNVRTQHCNTPGVGQGGGRMTQELIASNSYSLLQICATSKYDNLGGPD